MIIDPSLDGPRDLGNPLPLVQEATGPSNPATKPAESVLAASNTPVSSKDKYVAGRPASMTIFASVLFPTWRAP